MALSNQTLFDLFRVCNDSKLFSTEVKRALSMLPSTSLLRGVSLDQKIIKLYYKFRTKWKVCKRTRSYFEKKNMDWLRGSTDFESGELDNDSIPSTSANRGRPMKTLQECSTYSRKRKLGEVTEAMSKEHLSEALSMKYAKLQERDRSNITKAVLNASPLTLERITRTISTPPDTLPTKFTPEEALALFVDLGLSKEKYSVLRSSLIRHNVNILPNYKKIASAKKEAMPPNAVVNNISLSLLDIESDQEN